MSGLRLILEALRWATGVWLLWRVPRPRPLPDGNGDVRGDLDDVAVVVPARDEESTMPLLLAGLAGDERPGEVVVVDDHSSDTTAEVAARAGATVVAAPPLPDGWTGKAWACRSGVEATGLPTLVFLDADTELEPGGLARIVAEHRRRGGLVSVQPFHDTGRPYEGLSAFFNVVSMMGLGAFTPGGLQRGVAGAFGPCLVCARADYLEVGGHRAVRHEVVEDLALARRFAATGLPVVCLGGRGSIRFRMYPGGLAQLVEGWTKNFAIGAAASPPLALALTVVWVSGCISAGWYAAVGGGLSRATAVGLYAAYAGQLHWMLRRVGRFGWWPAVVFPMPLAFFLVVFARSLFLTRVKGEVRWRGRGVPVGGRRVGEGA